MATSSSHSGADVSQHYNNLKGIGRKQRHKSPIFYVRNFNNWVKAVLISKYVGLSRQKFADDPCAVKVFDLACGKGGDIQKWAKHEVDHVVFADIASQSVEECKSRFSNERRNFKGSFYSLDCSMEDIYEKAAKGPNGVPFSPFEFHLCSCQFSFHYSFESLDKANQMFQNAADYLKKDGYFIGTIPDANRIMKRLRESDSDLNSFGNSNYRITFPEDFDKHATPPLFGCKYEFYLDGSVLGLPEPIVYWPLFKYLAEKHGLQLVTKMSFDIFLKSFMIEEEGKDLLRRMRGLASFAVPLRESDNTDELEHVTNHLKSLSSEQRGAIKSIGTIPKEQWDISTLYLAFAFKKVR